MHEQTSDPANKRSAAAEPGRRAGKPAQAQFSDNRPEAIAQRKLREAMTNKETAQLQEGGAGPELQGFIAQLEQLAADAAFLGAEQKGIKELRTLQSKIEYLNTVAAGNDEQLKRQTLAGLKTEFAAAGFPAGERSAGGPAVQQQTDDAVQRLTGTEIAVIVVVGTTVLSALWTFVRHITAQRPTTSLTLAGIQYDNNEDHPASFASVIAQATLTAPTQRVFYDIRWDGAVVPAGDHLGQQPNTPGGWVEDLSEDGESVGDRNSPLARYFDGPLGNGANRATGLYFYFRDPIAQDGLLTGGSWWFRLRVVDNNNRQLSSSEVEVPWQYP